MSSERLAGKLVMMLATRKSGRTTALLCHLIVESTKKTRIFLVPTMPRRDQVLELAAGLIQRGLSPTETAQVTKTAVVVTDRTDGSQWKLLVVTPYQLTAMLQGSQGWDLIADHL